MLRAMRLLGFVLASLVAAPAFAATFRQADTSVVVISVARWPAEAGLKGFEVEERQELDLVYALSARGVPDERITLLRDAQATQASALAAIRRAAAGARPGSVLMIYLQGHGLKLDGVTRLALHDYDAERPVETGLALPELARVLVESWRGGSLILAGDFCYSGGLAQVVQRVSAARKGPAAAISSTVASDRATSRWTFLESLVQGLSGHADVDEDANGAITFREISTWVIDAMVHGEDQMAEVTMAGGFSPQLPLARVAAHTRQAPAPDGHRPGDGVEAQDTEGAWYPGRLLRFAGGRWRVHFSASDAEADEWVVPARIRKPARSPWRAGAPVDVEWLSDEWYAARIVEVAGGRMHFVHYEDTDSEDDEWVPASRIRARDALRGMTGSRSGGTSSRAGDGPLRRSRVRALRRQIKAGSK